MVMLSSETATLIKSFLSVRQWFWETLSFWPLGCCGEKGGVGRRVSTLIYSRVTISKRVMHSRTKEVAHHVRVFEWLQSRFEVEGGAAESLCCMIVSMHGRQRT